MDGPADAAAAGHFRDCPDCAAELESWRAVMAAAADLGGHEPPDPGAPYWEGFLSAVRSRLAKRSAARPGGRGPRWLAAAAALVMIAAAAGALRLPGVAPRPERAGAGRRLETISLEEASRRVDEAMGRRPALSGEATADLVGTDPLPSIGAKEILETMEDLEPVPGPVGVWSGIDGDELQRQLDRLDRSQALRLRAELGADRG